MRHKWLLSNNDVLFCRQHGDAVRMLLLRHDWMADWTAQARATERLLRPGPDNAKNGLIYRWERTGTD